jgi:hypothetical protein
VLPILVLMTFRQREAARIFDLREHLFSPAACSSLLGDRHHLGAGFETENLYTGFRQDALEFFKTRKIKWHGGVSIDASIVSSQVACLNVFFLFMSDPLALKLWLSHLYPDLQEVLPIASTLEAVLPDGRQPFLTFEWIGARNYLNERWGSRGQNCTSVDVMFRFRTNAGKIHVVLAEWKYCERDERAKYQHVSDRGTDRVATYRPQLALDGCQLALGKAQFEDLFFLPLYQLMRLQLLASAMEREHEMEADIVSVLHVAPRANDGLMNRVLSCKVAPGITVRDVWGTVAAPDRFKAVATEDLIPLLVESGADSAWTTYVSKRYGAMV